MILKMTVNIALKWEISPRAVTWLSEVFPGFYHQISPKLFCLQTVLQKMQVSKAQSDWLVFQEAIAYKRQGRADMRTSDTSRVKWVRQKATHSYGFYFILLI